MYKIETFEQACEAITNQGLELADLEEENNKLKADIKILKCNGDCVVCNEWLLMNYIPKENK